MNVGSKVVQVCEAFFDWRLREFPEFATFCGYHQYDDRLNDNSVEAVDLRKKAVEKFQSEVEQLKRTVSIEEDKLNLELLCAELNLFNTGVQYYGYLFLVNNIEGLHNDFETLTSWMKFKDADDYTKYIKRLECIKERLTKDTTVLRFAISKGYTYHRRCVESVPEQLEKIFSVPVEGSIFYKPLLDFPDTVPETTRDELRSTAGHVIQESVLPAFKTFHTFFQKEYMQSCRQVEGVHSLPNGREFYEQCIRHHISVNLTAEEIHQTGEREMKRIKQEMMTVKEAVGFSGTLKEFFHHIKTSPELKFADKESCLEEYRNVSYKKIRPQLLKLFPKIPQSNLDIRPTPPSRSSSPMAYYLAGTLDGSRPGVVYVNCQRLDDCLRCDVIPLCLHEGEPGHHFQGMYAIEAVNQPRFRRYLEDMYYCRVPSRFSLYTAYCEGWGLYSEYLGNELGFYEEDLYAKFGYLSYEMHRAMRLVVDIGIHFYGWSYEKAVDMIKQSISLPDSFIESEVRRYIIWPAQACAYKIGELKIKELREKTTTALGDRFDVRQFHDVILRCGMVPLTVLETIVDKHIADKLMSPV